MGRTGLFFVVLLPLLGVYVHGQYDVDILDFPYMASVHERINGNEYALKCHGVIIDASYILTTASCFVGAGSYDIMVRVGSNYADRGGIKLIGTQYTFHPQYKQDFDYDIGILRVSPPMVLNYRVAAVELPEQDSDMGDNRYGDYITWNFSPTQRLKALDRIALSKDECSAAYISMFPSEELFTDRMMCTETASAMCSHAPGSPFISRSILYGLYSWTYRCANPSVFTRVSSFISWIDSILAPPGNSTTNEI